LNLFAKPPKRRNGRAIPARLRILTTKSAIVKFPR
jgi:hypothetical protein